MVFYMKKSFKKLGIWDWYSQVRARLSECLETILNKVKQIHIPQYIFYILSISKTTKSIMICTLLGSGASEV